LEIGAEGVQFNANQLQAGQGSGLGLFISKGIATQHGGTFQVTSQGLDCGATFSIELPLFRIPDLIFADPTQEADPSSSSEPRSAASRDLGPGPPRPPRKPQRVLVVDDAISNRKLLLRILRTKEYICDEAENGRVAVERYTAAVERGEPFDAILSDYEMPVMNGPDAVWEMRELGCKCFIAGITGNVMQEDIDYFKEKGADCVLAKPLNTDVFESLFHNFKPRETPYGPHGPDPELSTTRSVSARISERISARVSGGGYSVKDRRVHADLGGLYEMV
jgi:CheY-like chemotaxis protein